MPEPLLQVRGVSKTFGVGRGRRGLPAVAEASFSLDRGETLGLVGESGCGKSTLARLILHLLEPDEGKVVLAGEDFTHADTDTRRRLRRNVQIVFQDALSSLNPRMTAGVNIAEPMRLQGLGTPVERRGAVRRMLELVGLRPADEDRYPHEFSGGQCQRIAIARALILQPELIVFDEAVSALDVSIRAQILRLILDLQDRFGIAYIFISHDLSVVKRIASRIAVMYLGRIVELGPSDALCRSPLHPYTEALLRAIPIPDPRRLRVERLGLLRDEPPVAHTMSGGCCFQDRCARRLAVCAASPPALLTDSDGRASACFLNHPPETPVLLPQKA
jgi:peptide/nickel transport system ATP-binding protein/oligopeptide transport system ATP-binding protein